MENINNQVETGVVVEPDIKTEVVAEIDNKEDCCCEDKSFLRYNDSDDIVIYGNDHQRQEMFKDWAGYIGEVENPKTTAVNTFLKKSDGSFYLYAPLDEVLSTTKPVLAKYGFGLFQSPTAKTGQVTMKTLLTHKSGGCIFFPTFTIPVAKNDAQSIIASVTYARRATLNPQLTTHGEADIDGNAPQSTTPKPQAKKAAPDKITQEVINERKKVVDLATELINTGIDRNIVNKIILDNCKTQNPNSAKDIELLEATYNELDKLRTKTKAN